MKKKLIILVSTLVLIGVAAATYALTKSDPASEASSTPSQSSSQTVGDLTTTKQTVAIVGTVTCLTPIDNSDTQASNCALGLQQDDGSSYALNAADPTTTGSLPTGERVEVKGVVTDQGTSYKTNGVIEVKSIERL